MYKETPKFRNSWISHQNPATADEKDIVDLS